nr:DUF6493 family protein [Streptomyces sp. NBC_00899]
MTAMDDETVGWDELRALIAGRVPQHVIERLSGVPASRLRHLRAPVKALLGELRREMAARDPARYAAAHDQLAATFVAGVLCSGTPREAFGWLTQRRLLDTTWPRPDGGSTNVDHHRVLALLLLDHRDRDWQRDLALRLAEWLPTNRGRGPWLITYGLAAWSETDLPTTDGFIRGWAWQGSAIRYDHHQEIREWFAEQGLRAPVPHHSTLLSWLRAEPRLAEYVPRLFEVDDIGAEFADAYAAGFGADNEWAKALTALADEGALDRGRLLDQCLAKLLRGDRPGNLRGFAALHDQLAPSRDETAARAGTYVRLAADGAGTVAKTAQKLLKALDAEGRLETGDFEELCAAVLTRPETAPATAQLAWMDKVLRRDPARAAVLVATAALAFGHPAVGVQERALALVGRWMVHLGPEVQEQVREAAGALDAALRPEAARLLGEEAGAAGTPPPPLPAVPVPKMPPAVGSPADLAERFAALLVARRIEAMELERVLEGAVVHHHADAAAVARAFAPLAARRPAQSDANGWSVTTMQLALGCLMDVLAGRSSDLAAQARKLLTEDRFPSVDHVPLLRVHEIAERLPAEEPPFLLATPTRADGSIDPAVLAGRLDRFRAASVTPWPDDLEQALLRIPPAARAAVTVPTQAGPGSDARTLPVFSGFHTQPFGVEEVPDAEGQRRIATPRVVPVMTAATPPQQRTLAAVLSQTPDPLEPQAYFWPHWMGRTYELSALWPSIAPHHQDLIAAHALPPLFKQAGDDTSRIGTTVLPLLAESAGSESPSGAAGPVVHLALAYGLTAASRENRTAAVDALLALAALGRLDAAQLADCLAALWHEHLARPNRFVAALGEAARAGAAAEVWTVVRTAVSRVVTTPALKGLPDLLALGSQCAAAGHVSDDFPELAQLALHARPARLATEAGRLQEILRG